MRIRRVLMSVDAVGGVWTYALELAAGLSAQGIAVLFAVLGPEPSVAQRRQAMRIRGLSIACGGHPLEWEPGAMPAQAAAGMWLLELARRWRPDLVHLNHYGHGHLPWPAPCLVVAHSCVLSWFEHVRHASADEGWADYRRGVTRGLRGTAMVVAPTRAMLKDTARLYGPLPRSRVIHNGRRLETFVPSRKQPFVFSAGRLWDDAKNIHLLGRVAAGRPIDSSAEAERVLRLDPALFRLRPDYLLRVHGDSMRDDGILDGDLIGVHATPEARHGQTVVARVGDGFTVKRLYRKGHQLRLLPRNPDYAAIDPDPREDFAIEGLFAGLIRPG